MSTVGEIKGALACCHERMTAFPPRQEAVMGSDEDSLALQRPALLRLAYRMLGSWADAEDVVQDALLRFMALDPAQIRSAEAVLRTIVTRLCLDDLKSARRRREHYVGPWLPEPDVVLGSDELEEDVTLPLLMALERLSPLERAAFLLHDVFGLAFEEIASVLERAPASCRQLATRARHNVRAQRPRYPLSPAHAHEIATAFFAASRSGNLAALQAMLSADVMAVADGGGKVSASAQPISGLEAVMALHHRLAVDFAAHPSELLACCRVNGQPGFISIEHGGVRQVTVLDIDNALIRGIYVIRNPDKLRHLGAIPLH